MLAAEARMRLLKRAEAIEATPRIRAVPGPRRPPVRRRPSRGNPENLAGPRRHPRQPRARAGPAMTSRMTGRRYLGPGDRATGRYDPPRPCRVLARWGPAAGRATC